jgi:hypothetical protein
MQSFLEILGLSSESWRRDRISVDNAADLERVVPFYRQVSDKGQWWSECRREIQ